jgi:hypothetical protein
VGLSEEISPEAIIAVVRFPFKAGERPPRTGTLNALRDELKRDEFDVAAANRALKGAVKWIVLDPETGSAELHWRDSDAVSEVPIWSRHEKTISDEEVPQAS